MKLLVIQTLRFATFVYRIVKGITYFNLKHSRSQIPRSFCSVPRIKLTWICWLLFKIWQIWMAENMKRTICTWQKIGSEQRSQFVVVTLRSTAFADENGCEGPNLTQELFSNFSSFLISPLLCSHQSWCHYVVLYYVYKSKVHNVSFILGVWTPWNANHAQSTRLVSH